jgi:hypothetical protein
MAEHRRFDVRKPLIAATVALLASLLVTIYGTDAASFFYSAAVAVLGSVALLGWIAVRAVFRKRQHVFMVLAIFGAYVVVTAVFFIANGQLRPFLRWSLWSHRYKSEVLAAPATGGEFKHLEWDGDGWGSGPTGDWMGYLVYDPSDSLSRATKNNGAREYTGIPCKVILVRRLEKQWYSVVLDMNQFWDKMHPGC